MTLKQPRLFEREPPRAIVTTAEGGCNPQSTRSMSEMERIKEEPVAEYDGSYECLICSESVRGTAALKCTQCQSNPVCMAQVVVHAYTIHVWHRCWYTHTHMCLCVLCL